MTPHIKTVFLLFMISLLSACAGQLRDYEDPKVNIASFKSLPNEGSGPRFEITLNIINPNATPLELRGLSYSLILEDHEVLTGVSNKLPVIPAYGEADIIIHATVDLLSSIRLIVDLMQKRREGIDYVLKAKLDPGGLRPSIRVTREGSLSFSGKSGKTKKYQEI